jgi:hypothetical protein
VIGRRAGIDPNVDTTAALAALESVYSISLWNLLPIAVLLVLGIRRYPAFLSILIGTLAGAMVAVIIQQTEPGHRLRQRPQHQRALCRPEERLGGHGQRLCAGKPL